MVCYPWSHNLSLAAPRNSLSRPIFSNQTRLDDVLTILYLVRGNRPGKPVQLQEYEIKYLCTKAREIFINQPILLELEAPIKICGTVPIP